MFLITQLSVKNNQILYCGRPQETFRRNMVFKKTKSLIKKQQQQKKKKNCIGKTRYIQWSKNPMYNNFFYIIP